MARRLATAALPAHWRESVLGDLEEERARRAARGVSSGTAWWLGAGLGIALRLRWSDPKTAARREWRSPRRGLLEALAADVRHAVRGLRHRRGFAAAAVLTLTLGLGANLAATTLLWHLLVKPLPWPQAERLVNVWNTALPSGATNTVAPANYLDFVREARSFEALAAYTYFDYSLNLTGSGEPTELRLRGVTAGYFEVFGVAPALGRALRPDDRRAVLLSHGVWQRIFGGDPGVVGKRVLLDDESHEVVGVMPAGFDFGAQPPDVWVPYYFTPELTEMRLGYFLGVVGRLRAGVSVEQASAEVAAVARRAGERFPPSNARIGATARSLRAELVEAVRPGLLVLAGASALVLLIACANLASLQLARSAALSRQLAVRGALGATRAQLVRLVVIEGVIVALAAGAGGTMAGWAAVRAAAAAAPPSLAQAVRLSLDPELVAYAFVLALISGALFSCVPAWRATRAPLGEGLRTRSTGGPAQARLRASLVTTEVALATTLLVSALVLLTSLVQVLRVDLGFDPKGVVIADLRLPWARYAEPERQTAFFDSLGARLAAAPRVRSVCATNAVPLEDSGTMTYVPEHTESLEVALPVAVTTDCFRTLDVPLRRGRLFTAREPAPVAVVSEGFARRAFPGRDAVGRAIRVGLPTGEPLTIIGVVGESRRRTVDAATLPQVYRPAHQDEDFRPSRVLLRVEGDPAPAIEALREAVRELDPSQPVGDVRMLEGVVARAIGGRRFQVSVLGAFAAAAALLAAVGIYGLLAQIVAQRRAEIGVRVALGAAPARIVRLVGGGAVATVLAGVLLGLAGAWLGSRVLARFVFGVSAVEPALYGGAAALLLLVAAIAAFAPVRRAARLDPAQVLRAD